MAGLGVLKLYVYLFYNCLYSLFVVSRFHLPRATSISTNFLLSCWASRAWVVSVARQSACVSVSVSGGAVGDFFKSPLHPSPLPRGQHSPTKSTAQPDKVLKASTPLSTLIHPYPQLRPNQNKQKTKTKVKTGAPAGHVATSANFSPNDCLSLRPKTITHIHTHTLVQRNRLTTNVQIDNEWMACHSSKKS